jgi:uncharacterized protein (DUF1697 family)
MPRYVALLRGINVGGHRVKMAALRTLYEEMGHGDVSTFIASGNVLFDSGDDADVERLRLGIEVRLREALGYRVATFLRTPADLAEIAAQVPFPHETPHPHHTLSIMFFADDLAEGTPGKLAEFRTEMDDFHVRRREIFWLCRGKTMQSQVDWPLLGRTVKLPEATVRSVTTVRKLALLCAPPTARSET